MRTLSVGDKWIISIKDFVYLLSNGILMYFRHTPPHYYPDNRIAGKTPVLILPGLFGYWSFLKPLADYISFLGYPVYVVPKLGNDTVDIPSAAKKVRALIEENNLENVIILAHSKGGLVGKYFLVHENEEKRVRGLVAVATPFHGSYLADFIKLPSVAELRPDGKTIKYLNDHEEVNRKIVSIIPSYDNIVWHEKGSYLEGAMQNIKVAAAGHNRIISDKTVWRATLESIEKISQSKTD